MGVIFLLNKFYKQNKLPKSLNKTKKNKIKNYKKYKK